MDIEDQKHRLGDVKVYLSRIEILLRKGNFDGAIRVIQDAEANLADASVNVLLGDRPVIWLLENVVGEHDALSLANSLENSNFSAIFVRDLSPLFPEQLRFVPNLGQRKVGIIREAFAAVKLTWPVLKPADEPFFSVFDKATAMRLQESGFLMFGELPRADLYRVLLPKNWEPAAVARLFDDYVKFGH